MESNTLSIIAIGIGVIALLACFGVYQAIPEEEFNPVTWGAITQYSDEIATIQLDITDMKKDIKDSDFGYDNARLDNIRDDIDDINDDIEDLEDDIDDIIDCLEEYNELNTTDFEDCISDKF